MYDVSSEYVNALNNKVIRNQIKVYIKEKANGYTNCYTDMSIIPNSLSVSNKCVSGTDFCLGSVYTGELNVSLIAGSGQHYIDYYDAEVRVEYGLELENGQIEVIPIGTFFVNEASQSTRILTLKCYDAMFLFDENIEEDVYGTPFELLSFICEKCGVILEHDESYFDDFANGNYDFSLYSEKLSTYRDAVSQIAIVLGGFATINRQGHLEIRRFRSRKTTEIPKSRKIETKSNNYKTFFSGVTCKFLVENEYIDYRYIGREEDRGLIVDLGEIPIVSGIDEYKEEILVNIYREIEDIEYYPCKISCITDPRIDLGDMIEHPDKYMFIEEEIIKSLVTGYTWRFRGKMDLQSVGSNPMLQIKSKLEKQLSQAGSGNGSPLIVHSYTNAEKYTILDKSIEIIRINYTTTKECKPIFMCTIPFTMDVDGRAIFQIAIDGEYVENGRLVQEVPRGKNFLSFNRYFADKANERHTLQVFLEVDYPVLINRRMQANIETIFNYIKAAQEKPAETVTYDIVSEDTTKPTLTIEQEDIRAMLFSDGIAGEGKWDGMIDFTEKFGHTAKIAKISSIGFNDDCSIGTQIPTRSAFVESFGTSAIFKASTVPMNITGGVNHVIGGYKMQTQKAGNYEYDSDYVDISDGTFKLRQDYVYSSQPRTIDEGFLSVVSIRTDDKQTIESVVIE